MNISNVSMATPNVLSITPSPEQDLEDKKQTVILLNRRINEKAVLPETDLPFVVPKITFDSEEETPAPIHKLKAKISKRPKPPSIRSSVTKKIFNKFNKEKISKAAQKAVTEGVREYFDQIADNLTEYAIHAHRKQIERSDVEVLFRRQRLIDDKQSLEDLIRKYLPQEAVEELIPIAKSGNKI